MRKIFTMMGRMPSLAAFAVRASARYSFMRLGDARKQGIRQKLLPSVFNQIGEQGGIDLVGGVYPTPTADYLQSLPVFGGSKAVKFYLSRELSK